MQWLDTKTPIWAVISLNCQIIGTRHKFSISMLPILDHCFCLTLHVELYASKGGPSGTSAKRFAMLTPCRCTTEAWTAANACLNKSNENASVGRSKGYLQGDTGGRIVRDGNSLDSDCLCQGKQKQRGLAFADALWSCRFDICLVGTLLQVCHFAARLSKSVCASGLLMSAGAISS